MHVGVVGAGITGLALVHELASRDVEVSCFEANPWPGGVIHSTELEGTVVEHGPQRMRLSGIVEEYLETFELRDDLVVAADDLPIFVYADGRLREVPFDLRTGLRTDALSLRGKLRLLKEPLTDPARSGETAASYFARKLGPEAYRNVIEPLFGGLYASDPARMPAEFALGPLLALEHERGSLTRIALARLRRREGRTPAVVPEAGMQVLPEAIAERYDERIALDAPVERIERDADGLVIDLGTDAVSVDEVVLATSAPAASELLSDIAPSIAEALGSLTYNPLAMVYLTGAVDRRGLGFQVRRDEAFETLGVSWNGVAFERDELQTAFLGGMHHPAIVERTDGELCSLVRDELAELVDAETTCLGVHRVIPGMPAYDHSWRHLEGIEPPTGIHLAGNYTARVGIPGRLRQARELASRLAGSGTSTA